jgi:hypothetical protein
MRAGVWGKPVVILGAGKAGALGIGIGSRTEESYDAGTTYTADFGTRR